MNTQDYIEDIKKLLTRKINDYDIQLLCKAFEMGKEAHKDQKRDTGEPYFSHPIQVSKIVAGLNFDTSSIIAALLHDTVEDTSVTLEDIQNAINEDVKSLVEGVTKLNKLKLKDKKITNFANENFRKFIFALSNDLRVVIVKLADRLHNMQTLSGIKNPERRHKIALETIEIYAPIARMIGLSNIQRKLEDLSFAELNPEIRDSILKRMEYLSTKDGEEAIRRITDVLAGLMRVYDIKCNIQSRLKTPFSIWMKMQEKEISFEELPDVMAFRIITENIADCYRVLGIIHTNFSVLFDKFKDYISIPKRNNYRSLHTTVIGPENKKIEIQIRTEAMHRESEYGIAAHSFYKDGKITPRSGEKGDLVFLNWLRGIKEVLMNSEYSEDIFNYTKMEMFVHNVFAFTPGGDIIRLPQGGTALDFAFAVHSEIGLKIKYVRVNSYEKPINYVVQNGDQIEVITDENVQIQPDWFNIAITGRAKSAINKALKIAQKQDKIEVGREKFKQECLRLNIVPTESFIKNILYHCKIRLIDDLYHQIGSNLLNPNEVIFKKIKEINISRTTELRIKNTSPHCISEILYHYEHQGILVTSFKILERDLEFIKIQISFRSI